MGMGRRVRQRYRILAWGAALAAHAVILVLVLQAFPKPLWVFEPEAVRVDLVAPPPAEPPAPQPAPKPAPSPPKAIAKHSPAPAKPAASGASADGPPGGSGARPA